MVAERIVLLGHTGFIGSRLYQHFCQAANFETIGCSLPEFDLTKVELTELLAPILTENTSIILTAAVKRQLGDSLSIFCKNMAIVENIAQLIVQRPVKQLIFFSSAAVYGEETENLAIDESTPVNPTSFYGIAKYSGERLLHKVCTDCPNISLICLRPPLIYGSGATGQKYGPTGFLQAALARQPITLWGDGSELREFIHVDDVCEIVRHLLAMRFSGDLNIVSGQRYSFADIIQLLQRQFPDLDVNHRERTKRKANQAFNPDRLKSLLPPDFQFTSLERGLSMMLSQA